MPHDVATIEKFRHFLLSSSKNTEQFDSTLLGEINVATKLDEVLNSAISSGNNVVIAGTAGSGKTHLIENLRTRANHLKFVEFGQSDPSKDPFIRTVSDLTAISEDQYELALERKKNCRATIVAANEGTLLAAGRREGTSRVHGIFGQAVAHLHSIQNGRQPERSNDLVVIDAAGFDPASDGVLEALLGLPILKSLMDSRLACDNCDANSTCVRRRSWEQLASHSIRARVCKMVSAASIDAEGFTFRTIWNFVSDLALGGSCADASAGIPTSAWFWRLFNGDSEISRYVRALYPIHRFALPHAESHLWYGDWNWLLRSDRLLRDVPFISLPNAPNDLKGGDPLQALRWLKCQALLLSSYDPFTDGASSVDAASLWSAAINEQIPELLRAMNTYMVYGLVEVGTSLELWIDYAMERRTTRPNGQVSLGSVLPSEFCIVRSIAASGSSSSPPLGARIFLRHSASGATLSLTRDLLNRISAGRSPRTVDREHTELDWKLMHFFGEVAATAATPSRLKIALFDFDRRAARLVAWDVHPGTPTVVLAQST